jgi:hypothetical protein
MKQDFAEVLYANPSTGGFDGWEGFSMNSTDPWLPLIRNSAFMGFGVMKPLFSRSGQCRTDHSVDPMVREDPKYP